MTRALAGLLGVLALAAPRAWATGCDEKSADRFRACNLEEKGKRKPLDDCHGGSSAELFLEISAACDREVSAIYGRLETADTSEAVEEARADLKRYRRKHLAINFELGESGRRDEYRIREVLGPPMDDADIKAYTDEALARVKAAPDGGRGERREPRAERKRDPKALARVRGRERAVADGGVPSPKTDALLAGSFLDAGSPGDAERLLDRALGAEPKDPANLAMRAAARAQQGKNAGAADDARAALKIDPGNEKARTILSLTASRVGAGPKLAPPSLGAAPEGEAAGGGRAPAPGSGPGRERAASAAPASVPGLTAVSAAEGHLKIADMKRRVGDLSGALLEASKAILADKTNPKAWSLRAAILNRLKSSRAALKDAEEALRLDPGNAEALVQRAIARHDLGDLPGALEDLARALERDPGNAMARLYRAMTLEKLGRKAEAIADYEAAARLDPSLGPLAQEGLARLTGGPASTAQAGARVAAPWIGVRRWLAPAVAAGLVLLGLWSLLARGTRWGVTGPQAPPDAREEPSRSDGLIAGQYRVEAELGRGGMGVVYRAFDETLKRPVAVKGLGLEASSSQEMRERFLREARLAAKLRHPNLAELFAGVEDGGELYLVFELIDGETLQALLARRGALPWAEARGLLGQVGSGLDYAHSQRVIHRDLKPANIMVGRDGRAKIMDFGIAHEARTLSGSTQTSAWGTPPYMAPEQVLGRVSKESDLYSLGVTAFELLTGHRPFDGPAMHDLKAKGTLPAVSALKAGLPAGLDAFFARALAPDPARRFSSAAEFLESLASPRG